jgi:hypothetical protein
MGQVVKKPKFKPRRISDEMPPIFPYSVWMRNVTVSNSGGGVSINNLNGVIVENLRTRGTPQPLTIKGGKRVYLKGLDFQR